MANIQQLDAAPISWADAHISAAPALPWSIPFRDLFQSRDEHQLRFCRSFDHARRSAAVRDTDIIQYFDRNVLLALTAGEIVWRRWLFCWDHETTDDLSIFGWAFETHLLDDAGAVLGPVLLQGFDKLRSKPIA